MPKLECETDDQLLKAFAEDRDEEAFSELVRRHGRLVINVCRSVLVNQADAEDATQAVFMALARQAQRWSKTKTAGAWLHRVAHGIAVDLLRARKARERREKEVAAMGGRKEPPAAFSDEQVALLHGEINALPEKYRQAVILCHLEGKSLLQAATVMACPTSTVGTWVERGRERLRDRLARRGLVLSLAALSSLLSAEAGAAEIPVTFVVTTTEAASLFAGAGSGAGGSAVALSTHITSSAEGALKAMSYAKLQMVTMGMVAVLSIGAGTGWLVSRAAGAEQPGGEQDAAEKASGAHVESQVRAEHADVKVLKSHTYGFTRRSTGWVTLPMSKEPVDVGLEHDDLTVYLTLMDSVVAVDSKTQKTLWRVHHRKGGPMWRTLSIVEFPAEDQGRVAVCLICPESEIDGEPVKRYLDFKTGKDLPPPAGEREKAAFLVDGDGRWHRLPRVEAERVAGLVSGQPDVNTEDGIGLKPKYRVIAKGVDLALEEDRLILMHRGGTKMWNSTGVQNRILIAARLRPPYDPLRAQTAGDGRQQTIIPWQTMQRAVPESAPPVHGDPLEF